MISLPFGYMTVLTHMMFGFLHFWLLAILSLSAMAAKQEGEVFIPTGSPVYPRSLSVYTHWFSPDTFWVFPHYVDISLVVHERADPSLSKT